ncbi:hypothetical protein [Pedobacter sp.]
MFDLRLSTVLGVELHYAGDGEYSLRYLKLKRISNELEVVGKKIARGPLVTVLGHLPKSLPVALVLSGKGVIHKTLPLTQERTAAALHFREAFPAIDPKDFYVQQFEQYQAVCLSISRKNTVDELLAKLIKVGLSIYSISFGAIPTVLIWPLLNSYGDELLFDGHKFLLEQKQFRSYQIEKDAKSPYPIKVASEVVEEEFLVCYASAFQLLLHERLEMIVAQVPYVEETFVEFIDQSAWKKRSFYFLAILFAALMISFLTFNHFNTANERLFKEVGAQTSSKEQKELLQQDIIKQEQLLKLLNWNGGYNYGYLVNELGSSMPRALALTGMVIGYGQVDEAKPQEIPYVKVSGTTDNLTAVNNWVFLLKDKKWVKGAKLLSFQEHEADRYKFEILISY